MREPTQQSKMKKRLIISLIVLGAVIAGILLLMKSNILNKVEDKIITHTGIIVNPLPNSMDLINFQDETFNTSFKASDIKDFDGELKIEMEVYQNSIYDAVEIGNLKIGDKIVFNNKEVLVETIDNDEMVIINGGTSVGGYCLESIGGGVYLQVKENNKPVYISVGVMSLKVDQDFKLIDKKDDNKIYFAGDLFDLMKTSRQFNVDNTIGRVANGTLVEIICN